MYGLFLDNFKRGKYNEQKVFRANVQEASFLNFKDIFRKLEKYMFSKIRIKKGYNTLFWKNKGFNVTMKFRDSEGNEKYRNKNLPSHVNKQNIHEFISDLKLVLEDVITSSIETLYDTDELTENQKKKKRKKTANEFTLDYVEFTLIDYDIYKKESKKDNTNKKRKEK